MERKVCDLKGCCFEITFYFLRSCCVYFYLSVSIQASFLLCSPFCGGGRLVCFSVKLFLKIIYTFVPWVTAL